LKCSINLERKLLSCKSPNHTGPTNLKLNTKVEREKFINTIVQKYKLNGCLIQPAVAYLALIQVKRLPTIRYELNIATSWLRAAQILLIKSVTFIAYMKES
jgi:hypothetical protein